MKKILMFFNGEIVIITFFYFHKTLVFDNLLNFLIEQDCLTGLAA